MFLFNYSIKFVENTLNLYTHKIFQNLYNNICSNFQVVSGTKAYLRPLSSAVMSQSQLLAAQNTTPVAFLPQVRSFQTSPVTRDIDSAAKFIGAGAATVGVAGSGTFLRLFTKSQMNSST